MQETLKSTLSLLDHGNDAHWTIDGLPAVEVVSAIADEPITRAQIEEHYPGYVRKVEDDAPAPIQSEDPTPDDPKATEKGFAALIATKKEEVNAVTCEVDTLQKKRLAMIQELDELASERNTKFPPLSQAEAYKVITDRAFESRKRKADQAIEVARILGANQPAPIDAAMRRSKGFGFARPKTLTTGGPNG